VIHPYDPLIRAALLKRNNRRLKYATWAAITVLGALNLAAAYFGASQ
jgi:hypothetical protein